MTARTSGIAVTAISCFVYFALALVVMHLLRPDYAPASHMISDYAVGPYGWVMTTAFLSLSGGCLTLAWGLSRGGPRSMLARGGVALLGLASAGLAVTAAFPTDLPGGPATRAGDIHGVSFLVNVASLIGASVLITMGMGGQPGWREHQWTSATLAALAGLALVLQFLTLRRGAPYGLANRLFATLLVTWLLATAVRLRGLADE
jgi:hypothetical membrane protein